MGMIDVQPDQTLPDLLAAVSTAKADGPTVTLWVPRGVSLLRQMESYQALKETAKREGVRLKILSPDPRVVGLALVFSIEAETVSHPPGAAPAASAPAAAPAPTPAPPPPAPADAIAPKEERPSAVPVAPRGEAAAPVAPPPVALPVAPPPAPPEPAPAPESPPAFDASDTDWLFAGEVDLESLLADLAGDRTATPPSDVAVPGRAAAPPAPPPAPAPGAVAPPAVAPPVPAPVEVAPPPAPPPAPAPGAVAPPAVAPPVPPAGELDRPPIASPNETTDLGTDWLTEGVDLAALASESFNPNASTQPTVDIFAPGVPDAAIPMGGPLPVALPVAPVPAPVEPEPAPPAPPPAVVEPPLEMGEFGEVAIFNPADFGAIAPFTPEGFSVAPAASTGGALNLSGLLGGDEDEAERAMSFSEWLALQRTAAAERAGAPAADVDLASLPGWLRPATPNIIPTTPPPPAPQAAAPPVPVAPTPAPPPAAPAPPPPLAPKGTLLCPHCGEPLDAEEMLRLLAEVWGT